MWFYQTIYEQDGIPWADIKADFMSGKRMISIPDGSVGYEWEEWDGSLPSDWFELAAWNPLRDLYLRAYDD